MRTKVYLIDLSWDEAYAAYKLMFMNLPCFCSYNPANLELTVVCREEDLSIVEKYLAPYV